MNFSKDEIEKYKEKIEENTYPDLVICPQDIYLGIMKSDSYKLGAQNVSEYDEGAYTGENSAEALKSLGTEYVIVGHSERRQKFKETNEQINNKIKIALKNKLVPILCIGESLQEKNIRNDIIKYQLDECLKGVNQQVIIAYEPIWAIGTGIIPTKQEIEETITYIKEINDSEVLYGGSVDENNIETLCSIQNIDGLLIGTASLDPNKLLRILSKIKQ